MSQEEGIVSTGAGTHSPHPLQVTAKVTKAGWRFPEHRGEYRRIKGEMSNAVQKCFRDLQEDSSTQFARHSAGTWKIGDFSDAPGALAE
jgi:hypothetical protein